MSEIKVGYRRYHNSSDLQHWITDFTRDNQYNLCYIAGHGSGGRLCGSKKNINLAQLANATCQEGLNRAIPQKGIFFGACEVGQKLEGFLNQCGDKIKWAGGYNCSVPWIESTLCDIQLLQYFYKGRVERTNHEGQDIMYVNSSIIPASSHNEIYSWMLEDCPMAKMFGLNLYYRQP